MKEYLRENPKGVLKAIPYDSSRSGDIEIPEGAEICYFFSGDYLRSGEDNFTFYKNGITKVYNGEEDGWINTDSSCFDFILNKGKLVWKREQQKVDKGKSTKKPPHDNVENNSVVSHPKHYVSDPCGVEAIEITSLLPACVSNATKYIWRVGKKDSSLQELEKALWYINYSIDNELPSAVNDLTDSMHFEELITKVKKHWSGWKYVFIDAVYWGDQQQMKRAIEGMIADLNIINISLTI